MFKLKLQDYHQMLLLYSGVIIGEGNLDVSSPHDIFKIFALNIILLMIVTEINVEGNKLNLPTVYPLPLQTTILSYCCCNKIVL